MVHEGMETQKTQGHGIVNTLPNDDYDIPLIDFMNRKKTEIKEKLIV